METTALRQCSFNTRVAVYCVVSCCIAKNGRCPFWCNIWYRGSTFIVHLQELTMPTLPHTHTRTNIDRNMNQGLLTTIPLYFQFILMGYLMASSHRTVHFENPLGCETHWTVQEVALALLLKTLCTNLYGTAVPCHFIPQMHCNRAFNHCAGNAHWNVSFLHCILV